MYNTLLAFPSIAKMRGKKFMSVFKINIRVHCFYLNTLVERYFRQKQTSNKLV